MNVFEIETTYKCNWNCEYCCVQTHTKRALSNEKILNNLKKSSNNYIDLNGGALTISGGEPSLTDPELIKEIYNLSKEHSFQLSLNTNGRIFYPKVYPIFKDIMKDIEINWHVSENCEWFEHIDWILSLIEKDSLIVQPMLVVTNNNVINLDNFMDNWSKMTKDIKILIVPASNPYTGKIYLDTEHQKSIYNKYKKYLTPESKLRLITGDDFFKDKERKITYIENYIKD